MMDLIEGVYQSFPLMTLLITLIGLIVVIRMIFKIFKNLYPLVRKRNDLSERYGNGSWVLITGSSDGT